MLILLINGLYHYIVMTRGIKCFLALRVSNKSMFQLENVLVLAELAALLRFLEINGKMVQLVLIVLPYWAGKEVIVCVRCTFSFFVHLVKVASAIFAGDNGSSPAFILSQDRTLLHSLHDSLMDIRIFCEEHGVICLECFFP